MTTEELLNLHAPGPSTRTAILPTEQQLMTTAIPRATDNEILAEYENALVLLQDFKHQLGKLEMEIYHRIEARGGTSLPNADENGEQIWVCEREDTFSYDQTGFLPLLEKFNRSQLEACYMPAHEETIQVEAKWKPAGTVMAIAKKHGDGAVEIVERAKVPKSSRIKFHRISREADGYVELKNNPLESENGDGQRTEA